MPPNKYKKIQLQIIVALKSTKNNAVCRVACEIDARMQEHVLPKARMLNLKY